MVFIPETPRKSPEPAKEFLPDMMAQFKKWASNLVGLLSRKEERVKRTAKPEDNPAEAERYDVAQNSIKRRLEAAQELQMGLS